MEFDNTAEAVEALVMANHEPVSVKGQSIRIETHILKIYSISSDFIIFLVLIFYQTPKRFINRLFKKSYSLILFIINDMSFWLLTDMPGWFFILTRIMDECRKVLFFNPFNLLTHIEFNKKFFELFCWKLFFLTAVYDCLLFIQFLVKADVSTLYNLNLLPCRIILSN